MKSGGSAKIWGHDIDADPMNARGAIGIVPQEINMDPFFTPRETLEIQAGYYGVPKERAAHRGDSAKPSASGTSATPTRARSRAA